MIPQTPLLCLCALALLLLAGCAGGPSTVPPGAGYSDPFEAYNRRAFAFNEAADKAVIRPVLLGYRTVTPSPLRRGLSNFLRNLREPMYAANNALQGDLEGAGTSLTRVAVNTFAGGLGLFDVAAAEGIYPEPEGFGQTLGVWGVEHGPYIVAPLIGPSSARDYVGYGVDIYFDPLSMYWRNVDESGLLWTRVGLTYLDTREHIMDDLQAIREGSADPYAATRSAYFQIRAAQLADRQRARGRSPATPGYDDPGWEDSWDDPALASPAHPQAPVVRNAAGGKR